MKRMSKGANAGWSIGLATVVLGAVALIPQLRADDTNQGAGGAARLSSVDGQVRISQGGQVLADPALVNTPLFAGTQIETGDDGKAEIQFDDGSIARISPDSSLTLRSIGDGGVTEIVLEGGLAYFELQGNGPAGDTRVRFGDAVATASSFAVMRIKLDNPPGELAVFSGDAHLQQGNALALDLRGGESIALSAGNGARYHLSQTIEPDSWDTWNSDRDEALNAAATDQTEAAREVTNNDNSNPQWNDLDANGNWYNVPGQGYVWSPYEASSVSWDPYGCGHWIWTPQFGYIWVSCESWGYLPYTFGTWSYYDGFGWGWAPGRDRQWWRGGGYRGINIGTRPRDYHPVPMPSPRGPIGRQVPRVISINRNGPDHGGEGLPVRNRNTPVEIGGHTVQPLRPLPTHGYQPTQSGFVYRPSQGTHRSGYAGANGPGNGYPGNGNPGSGNPGGGNPRWGSQGPGNPGYGNPGTTNRGSAYDGSRSNSGGNDARGGSGGGASGRREGYTPAQPPRYVAIPAPPPPAPSTDTPGGNNGAPNPGGPPNDGRPALGGLVPRDYNRYHPDSGVDREGNGTGQSMPRPTNGGGGFPAGGQPVTRPSNPGGNSGGNPVFVPNPNPGGSFSRPSNLGGGQPQPSPRPSGGGGPNGGGGQPAPHPSGGAGNGAPHGNGGGQHGDGGRSVH